MKRLSLVFFSLLLLTACTSIKADSSAAQPPYFSNELRDGQRLCPYGNETEHNQSKEKRVCPYGNQRNNNEPRSGLRDGSGPHHYRNMKQHRHRIQE